MKQADFEMLNNAGVIDHVAIFKDRVSGEWNIFAYGATGSASHLPDYIEPARTRSRRSWATLDSASAWLRKHGWHKQITLDD